MAASIESAGALEKEIRIARNELKNIRQQVETLKKVYRKDVDKITESLAGVADSRNDHSSYSTQSQPRQQVSFSTTHSHLGTPIGYIKSCFKSKNGTPRQPTICSRSKAKLQILQSAFNNPAHALEGLQQFSHLWIIFIFHRNGPSNYTKAKVKPPRLDGARVGLFASRSPHRPNPIGLTLVHIDSIQGDTIHMSGIDMIEGTPVLDIKPYIPTYDNKPSTKVADWIGEPPRKTLNVRFTLNAEQDLQRFRPAGNITGAEKNDFVFDFFEDALEAKKAIRDILESDPRSTYRRYQCKDSLYYFTIDTMHITCWFDDNVVEVVKIKPAQRR
uniref:Nef-associated protein 1-like n=1 Tax=Saccoglossus kowalevskii TaxID=10224 RepID=A0ABM0M2G0_SACKO|nr:PREDICTED: nef-associated protein 1-like [Saccoglossus kowalevskii]